jgi:carboxymethylenebutenolidase
MLPGVPPTGRRVEVAVCSIVKMQGEKVAHEHIYWDQASVLAQLGLLDAERLPATGAEAARKVLDHSLPVKALMQRTRRGAGAPPAHRGDGR